LIIKLRFTWGVFILALPINNNISSAFANGALGIQRGSNQITQAASELASSAVRNQTGELQSGTKMTDALIDLQVGAINTQTSAKVLSTANDTLGTLLDTFA
jgi:hypothetical protein